MLNSYNIGFKKLLTYEHIILYYPVNFQIVPTQK